MKPRFSNQPTTALTLNGSGRCHCRFGDCGSFLFAGNLAATKRRTQSINCVNNLKQIGIAFRLWEGDNNDKYPMAVSVTNGGAMELVATGNVAACFQVMSNELNTPKILLCPEDTRRVWATNFSTLNNSNISYFVGLDVTNDTNLKMLLSGDDNFAIGGVPVKSGVLQLLANTPIAWTKGRHKLYWQHWLGRRQCSAIDHGRAASSTSANRRRHQPPRDSVISGRAALPRRPLGLNVTVRQHRPSRFQFASIREIRVKSLFLSGFRLPASVCSATMFETVKSEITTASGKLTHLRRFL